jgi:hypothetical protein
LSPQLIFPISFTIPCNFLQFVFSRILLSVAELSLSRSKSLQLLSHPDFPQPILSLGLSPCLEAAATTTL